MLLFYDAHFSGNTYKVRLLLSQLRLPHEVVRLDLLRGEVRTPEFRKQNPFGRVPFVVDGEFALAESNAILLWLSRGTPLLPADERQQALVQQWMFFEQNQLELSVGIPRLARKIDLGLPREVLEWHFPRAVAALKVLERHLASRSWLVGDACSVADLALFAYAHLAPEAGHDLSALPAVSAWLQRVREQPGWIAME